MPTIARILKKPLPEVIRVFRKANVGDLCPCGCGGKTILTDDPKARVLAVELACTQCGAIRRYRYQTARHYKLCKTCSRSNERVERTEFICAGYLDHGALRHAKNCPRTTRLAPYQIKNRALRKKRKPHLVFDAFARIYQSPGCASAGRLVLGIEKRLRKFLRPGTKIRSRKQRSNLLHKYEAQMNPKFGPDIEKIRNRRRRPAPGMTKAKTIYWWSRPANDLPRFVRFGFCIFCERIAIRLSGAKEPPRWHRQCWITWKRTPEGKQFQSRKKRGLEASMPQPHALQLRVKMPIDGMSGTEDSLKISFSWAIQHYFKEKSYPKMGRENGVDWTSARDRVAFLISKLPAPELLVPRFGRIVRLLLDAATLKD